MLRTEQILNAKFTPVSKGTYNAEEVDAFLKTVAASYENSLKENQELIKKISILADKIESYRNDEEAIKLALLDAHKMAETVNKSANEKAQSLVSDAEGKSKIILDGANRQSAQMIEEAREKAKEIVDNARTAVASLTERAQIETDNTIADAKKKAAEIVANAEEKGREIIGTSKQSYEFYSAELEKIQSETAKFKSSIEEICKGQLNLLGDIPASFAAVVSAAAAIPVVSEITEEEPVADTVEAEKIENIVADEAFDSIIDEIDSAETVETAVDEPEEEHDPSAIALMAEINGLADEVMSGGNASPEQSVVDNFVAEAETEEPVDSDDDDLFSLIEDADFDDVQAPDSIPSSLDDLIPEISFEPEEDAKEEESEDDSSALVFDDDEDDFDGFKINLDEISDDKEDDDEDITSLFDSLFDE